MLFQKNHPQEKNKIIDKIPHSKEAESFQQNVSRVH
jgi:hypothetical protein